MKAYFITIATIAIIISVSDLITPDGKMKDICKIIMSFLFLTAMLKPIAETDFSKLLSDITSEASLTDETFLSYVEEKEEKYYENYYYSKLKEDNIIAESVNVTIEDNEIKKVEIKLSNPVMADENEHINIIVVKNYIANLLGLNSESVTVYE